jgi:tricorn protease
LYILSRISIMHRPFIFLLALCWCAAWPAQAQPDSAATPSDAPFLRFPAVSPDGQQVAFSYQGDLWTVPVRGGTARRLTVHEAYEAQPHWRPNGREIAFTSDRNGNDDVFVMGANGARPQRLTYHSADDDLGGWTPDGDLLFTTDRNYVQVEWEDEVQRVSSSGGTPDRVLDALGAAPAMSPDGRFIALERGSSDRSRKGYEGPASRDLWIYDRKTGDYHHLTNYAGSDFQPVWVGPRALIYISERSGTYNVYRQRLTGEGTPAGEPQALTDFTDGAVRHVSASSGGEVVTFARNTHVYVMRRTDGEGAGYGEPERLTVDVPRDYRFDPVERKTFNKKARRYAVSPGGEHVAFVVRGEIFLMRNDPESKRTVRLTDHAYRDRDVAWLDRETLIFASDRNGGQYDFYRLEAAGAEEKDLMRALQFDVTRLTDTEASERSPVVAPDSQHVAFQRGRGRLVTAALTGESKLGEETTLLDGWADPSGVTWSPDSRWLAYSLPGLDFNHEVYIHAADGSREPVNVSQHPRPDSDPVWSPDGSKLAFTSSRSSGDDDVWFAWLQEADWEKTRRDWQLEAEREEQQSDSTGHVADTVEIDFEGLYERLEQVTARPGNEADPAIGPEGETFYYVAGRGGRTQNYSVEPDLFKVKWDGTDGKRLTEGGNNPHAVHLGPKNKHLFMRQQGGRIARLAPKGGSSPKTLRFQAQMRIDHEAERRQVFHEAWRTLEKNFYDPDFHGTDWRAMRDKYRPWALRASTDRDFQAVINWMLGELNASHMGFYGSDRAETQNERTGLLGVTIDPAPDDGVEITRVVPESPADRAASRLREGEVITAVDGTPVAEASNFYALLTGKAGERVLLGVRGEDGASREVTLRAAKDLDRELYQEWVDERKRLTEEYSDGRLGYVHIEGMNWASFERFEREITASGEGKEGLIVDVRYNGGGWTTDYLLSVLTVRQHAYTVPRGAADNLDEEQTRFRGNYPFGERLPFASWTGHTAALANQNSYSNAEIFSHAFKSLGLGPLVGTPTSGAVISTGGRRLLGGAYVRVPYRGWYVRPTRQNMELGPAVPDIRVENAPDAKATGEDAQLRRAVQALLQNIEQGRQPRPGLSEEAPSASPETERQ